MTNADRAIGMAKGAKTYQPLSIASGAQFSQVLNFSKVANYAGKGALIFDAGIRINGVRADKAAGNDWQRKAVMETTGFGLGAAAGVFTGSAIIGSTVGIALMATPLWVGFLLLVRVLLRDILQLRKQTFLVKGLLVLYMTEILNGYLFRVNYDDT